MSTTASAAGPTPGAAGDGWAAPARPGTLRILFIGHGADYATSRHRAGAWRRLGHAVTFWDPESVLGRHARGPWRAVHYRTGYRLLDGVVRDALRDAAGPDGYDLAWVDGGELLGPRSVRALAERAARTVLFNHDDPTGPRDRARFASLRRAVPSYDLCVTVRAETAAELVPLGARAVLHTWRTYDEVAHRLADEQETLAPAWSCDVGFVGTNIPGERREDFVSGLIARRFEVAVWGDRWTRRLGPYHRGPALAGQDYVRALRGARVSLGLLSRANRDLHTTRSMEIPYAGGLLCAERTAEHRALYREGEEAVFWSSLEECVEVCRALLADPERAARIRAAGRRRVVHNRVGNEDLCRAVLARLAHAA